MDIEKNKISPSTLYLVATPIGNLADISERALKVLREVDFVAAEDTRVTGKLLSVYGISARMVNYHEHNKKARGEEILKRLSNGENCALVTDAGTPAISDPGADIVALCADAGIDVVSIPGACAAVTALSVSGLDTRRFCFEGFLEGTKSQKIETLERIRSDIRTTVFYEAPHRLADTLSLMLEVLGDRKISLCRELTKLNEEIVRTTLSDAVGKYENSDVRGEFVLVIEGANEAARDDAFWHDMSVEEHVTYYTKSLGMEKMDAIKAVAKDRGVPKGTIYKQMIK